MTLSKLERSHLVIHSCAIGAAGWSALWGAIPVGGITPDTAGLIAICQVMGGLLARIFDMSYALSFASLAAAAGQYFAGALIIKVLAGLIPVFGSAVNGVVSFATVEIVGWGLYLILDDGKDLNTLSKKEIVEYLERGKKMRTDLSESGQFAWMNSLPSETKKELDELSKEMTNSKTSYQRRDVLANEIGNLVAPYRK